MRKQYHLRPAATGVDAWDVDRLIDLSRGIPVREVSLDSITEIDSDYWFFNRDGRPTVRDVAEHARLINEVDTRHAVILAPDGRLLDGMHRVARALLDGRQSIRAVRLESTPDPDFRDCDPADLPY